jgi:hypothetical protein
MHRDGTPSGGRPKGAVSEKTRQIQAFCRSIVEDPEYRETVLRRARSCNLGAMEPVIWAYGYGKPKESVDVRLGRIEEEDLNGLSTEELTLRAEDLVRQLREAESIEAQLQASLTDTEANRTLT